MIKIPNYTITKKIASGGMGDVYLAKHKTLDKTVAIKSLHANLVNDDNFRKRFITEAKTHYKLKHPNIVELRDFQEQENGLFLIMEYVEGKQLNDYIKKDTGPIPEDDLIPLFIKILEAIEYAHSKKLIHRDIKPANILITKEGDVKVIDFGIVKNDEEDHGLTKADQKVGTVSYMSPEQVNGEKIDKLSDIYSLGVTLYQMAVGKAPYEGQTNSFKIQTKIVNEPLPDPKKVYPGISEKLIQIIEKATNKDKKKRYKSCKEFIKAFSKEVKPKTVVKETSKKKTSKTRKNIDTKTSQGIKTITKNNNKIVIAIGIIFMFLLGIGSLNYFFKNESGETVDENTRTSSTKSISDSEINRDNNLRIAEEEAKKAEEEAKKAEEEAKKAEEEAKKAEEDRNTRTSSTNSISDSEINRDDLRIAEEERRIAEEERRIAEEERRLALEEARKAEDERRKAQEERRRTQEISNEISVYGIIKSSGFNSQNNFNNNKPVDKARITLGYNNKVIYETKSNGKFNFSINESELSTMGLSIIVNKDGFTERRIILSRSQLNNNNDIYIIKINLVSGKVLRRNSKPAKNAQVIASKERAVGNAKSDPNRITKRTSSDGSYIININKCFDCIYIHFIDNKKNPCGNAKLISSNKIDTRSCN